MNPDIRKASSPSGTIGGVSIEASGDLVIATIRLNALMGEDATSIGNTVLDETKASATAARLVALDMHRVEMLNSVAIGMLVTLQTSLLAMKIEFVLLGVRPSIRELLHTMRLDSVFRFVESRTELATA
ncbi:MAG: STAS domain-containing protein [Planctomycetota bacterium]